MGSEALPLRPLRRPLAVFLLLVLPALAVAGPSTPDAPALAFTGTAGAATTGPEPPGATGSGSTTWSPRSVPGPSPASPAAGAGAGAPSPGPSAEALPEVPEAAPRPGPWPEPVTDVTQLCTCDLFVDQCDINCCCDPTCTAADFSLFTTCSIPVVTGDSQLCRQQAALYSIDIAAHPPERLFQVTDKVNPSVFCIQTANYKDALSFQPPEMPTLHNFDRLLQEFGGFTFDTEMDLALPIESATHPRLDSNEASRYEYSDPIQTTDGFLRLPAPLFLSQCTDKNPAGFLVNQAVKCKRMIQADECTTLPPLSMDFYTSSSILAVPKSSQTVNITVQSITLQTPEGLRTRLKHISALLDPVLSDQGCTNAVLGANYLINFTEAGEITGAAVSFVLGVVNMTASFIQQSFELQFVQQHTLPLALSGNPGYVVGLPIKAGFRSPDSGVIQSANEAGQLTIMKSTPAQDCFAVEGARAPVLFGSSMLSGCQLRLAQDADCQRLAPVLLDLLKGQNFPDCVASFGNSQPQYGLDWVQIHHNVTKSSICEIPVSFDMEVKWTKFGSLLNPQAQIVSVTVTVATAALPQINSISERTVQILSSVTFVDVSAPATPGYKVQPTIEANLPYDFFFPFV